MTKRRLALIASLGLCLGLGFGGCGKKEKENKKNNTRKKAPGKTVTKKGPSTKSGPAFGGKSKVDLKKLIDTETAIPFGEFKKIKLGMTKEEVVKINPAFVDAMKGHVHGGVTYNAFSGRPMAKGDKNKFKIHTLGLSFYANFKYVNWQDVKAQLDAKWGKSTEHADFNMRSSTSHFWFNPTAGIRAMLNGFDAKRAKMGFAARLRFQAYVPLAKWLGEPGKPLPFLKDGKPLIGMAAADVKKAYDYEPKKSSSEALPYIVRTEWDGDLPPAIMVWAGDDGKVNKYTITLRYKEHPKGEAPVVAAIKAKYPGKELAGEKWAQVATNVWVSQNKGSKEFTIRVGTKP